uniref:Uncharacterized protein n=1 Tax=Anguilla anguilla TaxID=7936 RepID=A0A0E9WKN9_ANGAN
MFSLLLKCVLCYVHTRERHAYKLLIFFYQTCFF